MISTKTIAVAAVMAAAVALMCTAGPFRVWANGPDMGPAVQPLCSTDTGGGGGGTSDQGSGGGGGNTNTGGGGAFGPNGEVNPEHGIQLGPLGYGGEAHFSNPWNHNSNRDPYHLGWHFHQNGHYWHYGGHHESLNPFDVLTGKNQEYRQYHHEEINPFEHMGIEP